MTTSESWSVRKLSETSSGGGVSHSYYDIPVFDADATSIVAHRLPFTGRHPTAEEPVEVGLVACNGDGDGKGELNTLTNWVPLGESRAWSWQQGPMAQWVAGGPQVVWNDREPHRDAPIVARLHNTATGITTTLPGQVYAVDPTGSTALSLNMMRLDTLRPGYGLPGGDGNAMMPRPADDGVWRMALATGERQLILSVARAVAFLNEHRGLRDRLGRRMRGMHYWFNHAKISPDGTRFTVKLRWRRIGGPWNDRQGVSLTCGMDGEDVRLLAPATSHVIWRDDSSLYFWQRDALRLFEDTAPTGTLMQGLAPELVKANVHIRHLDKAAQRFVLDTPYKENVALKIWDAASGAVTTIAQFSDHIPPSGPFRCDLHPCPAKDGERIALTSLEGGRRALYLAQRDLTQHTR